MHGEGEGGGWDICLGTTDGQEGEWVAIEAGGLERVAERALSQHS